MPRMPGMPGMPSGFQMPAGFQMPQGTQVRQMPQFARMPQQQFGQNLDALEQKYGIDPKRWRCVYPCYINIKKTLQQGRKIAKKFCVEQPHPTDIAEVCKYLGLPFYIEVSIYPCTMNE